MMIRTFCKYNIYLIFIVGFAVIGVFMSLILGINTYFMYADILSNGIKTKGYIIPDSYESNLMVNDTDYYHIDYYFVDEDGNTYEGQTSDAYLYSEIMGIIETGYIWIKYDPESLQSIESTYKLSDTPEYNILIAVLVFTVFIEIILIPISIKTGLHNIALLKVEEHGTEYDAIVTRSHTDFMRGRINKYRVYYKWTDIESGPERTGSSRPKYLYYQARVLEAVKNIKIKAIGDKSYILTDPDVLYGDSESYAHATPEQIAELEDMKKGDRCKFCGGVLLKMDKSCPHCYGYPD